MQFNVIGAVIVMTSVFVSASTSIAQSTEENPSSKASPVQSDQGQRPMGPAAMGRGMMTPEMMQMIAPMLERAQDAAGRGPRSGGPFQIFSKLLTALDDTRLRTMLGLTDQQADGLRKIIVDTETFTIRTGANIAVDSIDLRELLRADRPDRTAVMAKGDEISKLTSQSISRYLDAVVAAKAILTPDQQKMIRAYMESGAPFLAVPRVRP